VTCDNALTCGSVTPLNLLRQEGLLSSMYGNSDTSLLLRCGLTSRLERGAGFGFHTTGTPQTSPIPGRDSDTRGRQWHAGGDLDEG
jgi:hypothetical protein